MKRIVILIFALCVLLTGCSIWMDGEYHSVKPHVSDGIKLSDDVVTVSDYSQVRDALIEMIQSGKLNSNFYMTGTDTSKFERYMRTAIAHVTENTPLGAYAVDEISYEIGINGGITAAAVEISYIHGRQEILRIKNAENMDEAKKILEQALNHCDASAVIYVEDYKDQDIAVFVQEYADNNPHLCMETPQTAISLYPENGDERILEINFTYQTGRDLLRNMQNTVAPIFSAAELYVQSSENADQKYEQLYSFLMERFDYTVETSITPTYSLLRYGVGDSKAFATVYSIMCQNAQLQCQVVSGTRNGEAHYWNLIRYQDADYHVDLLASNEAGEFMVMRPEEMTGYVWDYSVFQ